MFLVVYSCKKQEGLGDNIFIDSSTSNSWGVQFAHEVVPCITPSHGIYSGHLKRYLQVDELLDCQAIFRCDHENKKAYDSLLTTKTSGSVILGQELAGNSFTGTVVQAVLLATLCCTRAWDKLADTQTRLCQAGEPCGEITSHTWCPTHRLRSKTRPWVLKKKAQRVQGAGGGNREATGKKATVSILQNERICAACDEIKATGVTNNMEVHRQMLAKKLHGYYYGCNYPSKWGKMRQEQQWTVLVQAAPKMAAKFKELPNSIREVLQVKNRKGAITARGDQKSGAQSRYLPHCLKLIVEGMVMDRIEKGEEVSTHFVSSCIMFCSDLWNEVTNTLRPTIEKEIMAARDDELSRLDPADLDKALTDITTEVHQLLRPVALSPTDSALASLGCNQHVLSNYLIALCNYKMQLA